MSEVSRQIEEIKKQEKDLVFDRFNTEDAYAIGTMLWEKAKKHGVSYGINITLNRKQLFHLSMEGATPDNDRWIARKENVVYHFFASSYRVKLELDLSGEPLFPRYGLRNEDYVLAEGPLHIIIQGVGVVGTVTVSGLPEKDDHDYVTSTVKEYLETRK